jgi:hypothetical protein
MRTGSAKILRRPSQNLSFARPEEAVRLGEDSRALFRNHLLRLDEQARRERFGACGLRDAFLESYAQNINFSNTALFGLLVGRDVRASAELRSLAASWERQAELAVVFEPAWKRCGEALYRQVFRFANQFGLLELYTYCDLGAECTRNFLRFLGKERQYSPCGSVTTLDASWPAHEDPCSVSTSNVILLRLLRTSCASEGP